MAFGGAPSTGAAQAPARSRFQRTTGALSLAYEARAGRTVLSGAYRAGAARIFEPGPPAPVAEGVLVNTAGGITGGDRFSVDVSVGGGASALLTTQACEKVYKAEPGDPPAEVATSATLAPGAALSWLPQPTILFDRARLSRRLEVSMAPDARLLALESVILGRRAMGERVTDLFLLDAWRIRRGGTLVFADATRLEGDLAPLASPSGLAGATAFALLLLVAPDSADRLENVRTAIDGAPVTGGASAFEGPIAVRLLAEDGARLVAGLTGVLPALSGADVPRMWSI